MKTTHEAESAVTGISRGGSGRTAGAGRPQARRAARVTRMLGATLLLLGLSACSLPEAKPDLTRYYVLTPAATKTEAPATVGERTRVFVRSVGAPEFLRGKIMQVRVRENELRFVDEARWAEPIEAGVLRVLRENLDQQAALRLVDRGGEAHDYDVAVQLRRCEGVLPAGVARVVARIDVFTAGLDPKLVTQEEFTSEIPGWDGVDHAELARKLSEAAAALSDRIAAMVPAKKSGPSGAVP